MEKSESSNRKNRKRYFQSKAGNGGGKKQRRNRLEPGMKGFIVTCSNNDESKCVREVYNLLNECCDRMGDESNIDDKAEKKHTSGTDEPQSEKRNESDLDEEDLETALKNECDALTGREAVDADSTSKITDPRFSSKRFTALDTGVTNNIFVATTSTGLDPSEIVRSILLDIKKSGKCQSRFIQRLLPVEISCKAYLEDIERALLANKELVSKHFVPEDKSSDAPSYAIFFKPRNNDHLRREDILRVVGDFVVATNPMATVNLEKPKKSILIEVLQTVACISIVDEYMELCKFNLHMVSKADYAK